MVFSMWSNLRIMDLILRKEERKTHQRRNKTEKKDPYKPGGRVATAQCAAEKLLKLGQVRE